MKELFCKVINLSLISSPFCHPFWHSDWPTCSVAWPDSVGSGWHQVQHPPLLWPEEWTLPYPVADDTALLFWSTEPGAPINGTEENYKNKYINNIHKHYIST